MLTAVRFERPVDRDDEVRGRPGEVRFLELPERRFVMVDGDGPPTPEAMAARLPALYPVAYGLHFALRKRGIESRIGPLEGLWWTLGEPSDLAPILDGSRTDWRWTLMIELPDETTLEEVDAAVERARAGLAPEIAAGVRVEPYDEGPVAQLVHVGPYDAERPSIERLLAAIAAAGLRPCGRHHELYLSNPRRATPDRLRTILRQPVEVVP